MQNYVLCIKFKNRWCVTLRKRDAFCAFVLYGIFYLAVGSSLYVCVGGKYAFISVKK